MSTAIDRLRPGALRTSGKMMAILGFVCGMTWTRPAIVGLVETTDGFVLACTDAAPLANDFLGSREDLDRNLRGAADAAGLTDDEAAWLMGRAETLIRRM